jgi:hypothetical protein
MLFSSFAQESKLDRMTDNQKIKKTEQWFWPNTGSIEGARAAARQGVWAASFVAVVTFGFAIYSRFAAAILNIDIWALVDVFLFCIIAVGIWRVSRIAAVSGLMLYVLERVWMFQTNGQIGGFVAIIIVIMFVNSIRGTFAYHRQSSPEDHSPDAT